LYKINIITIPAEYVNFVLHNWHGIAMKTAQIPVAVRDVMFAQSRAELPNECCGLLLGTQDIERAVPMRSIPPAPDAYYMDPEQQITVFTDMQATGEQLLGIYHSHPKGPVKPSGMDLQLAFHPDALYVIISLADVDSPEIGAYRLVNSAFTRVALTFVER
jgi:proteasome lid subunit RPN8/RPN11